MTTRCPGEQDGSDIFADFKEARSILWRLRSQLIPEAAVDDVLDILEDVTGVHKSVGRLVVAFVGASPALQFKVGLQLDAFDRLSVQWRVAVIQSVKEVPQQTALMCKIQ